MADRPILFSGAMVRANRDGIKTNTRRGINPQPEFIESSGRWRWPIPKAKQHGCDAVVTASREWHEYLLPHQKPWFSVGDRLWVREEFSGPSRFRPKIEPPASWPVGCDVWYWADGNPDYGDWTKPKPAMHMPRWMSRLTLIVTGVKIERLQDISREDAIAEGLEWIAPTFGIAGIASTWNGDPRESYFALWDHINGAGAGAKNPWVVAYAYTVHRSNIDQIARAAA